MADRRGQLLLPSTPGAVGVVPAVAAAAAVDAAASATAAHATATAASATPFGVAPHPPVSPPVRAAPWWWRRPPARQRGTHGQGPLGWKALAANARI